MTQILKTFLVTSILGIIGCEQQPQKGVDTNAVDNAAIIKSIDSLGAVVQKAHTTGDAKLLASTWAKDGIFFNCGSEPVRGRDAIVAAITNMPALPPGTTMTVHPLEIQVLSRDWVYVSGVDSLRTATTDSVGVNTLSFSVIVKRTDEGWQTYRETLSANQP